jgi:hypothetical protein
MRRRGSSGLRGLRSALWTDEQCGLRVSARGAAWVSGSRLTSAGPQAEEPVEVIDHREREVDRRRFRAPARLSGAVRNHERQDPVLAARRSTCQGCQQRLNAPPPRSLNSTLDAATFDALTRGLGSGSARESPPITTDREPNLASVR